MDYEFEGKTETDAIEIAAIETGLDKDNFDVEIIEAIPGGLFKKGKVRIKIHPHDTSVKEVIKHEIDKSRDDFKHLANTELERSASDIASVEEKAIDFISGMMEKMGYQGKVSVLFREGKKIGLKLDSDNASILIGKKGKTLDAMQLLANVFVGKMGFEDIRIVLDSENYRIRREESLVRLAYETAERVRRTKQSLLLEPMNPFERRIIHTTLNDIIDIETKSEGDGLYKQVRVFFKGSSR